MQPVDYPCVAESESRKGMTRFPNKASLTSLAVSENKAHSQAMRQWPPSETTTPVCMLEAPPIGCAKMGEMGSRVPLQSGDDGFCPMSVLRYRRSTVDMRERTLPSTYYWHRIWVERVAQVAREYDQAVRRGREATVVARVEIVEGVVQDELQEPA